MCGFGVGAEGYFAEFEHHVLGSGIVSPCAGKVVRPVKAFVFCAVKMEPWFASPHMYYGFGEVLCEFVDVEFGIQNLNVS